MYFEFAKHKRIIEAIKMLINMFALKRQKSLFVFGVFF